MDYPAEKEGHGKNEEDVQDRAVGDMQDGEDKAHVVEGKARPGGDCSRPHDEAAEDQLLHEAGAYEEDQGRKPQMAPVKARRQGLGF